MKKIASLFFLVLTFSTFYLFSNVNDQEESAPIKNGSIDNLNHADVLGSSRDEPKVDASSIDYSPPLDDKSLSLDEKSMDYSDYEENKDYGGLSVLFAQRQYLRGHELEENSSDLVAGDGIEIESVRGIEPTLIIPLSLYGKVEFLAHYRKYNGDSDYELASMSSVGEYNWEDYPPLSADDARYVLQESYPLLEIVSEAPSISFYSDTFSPQYEFVVTDGSSETYKYVDINSAAVNNAEQYVVIEDDKEHPFVFDSDGLVELNLSAINSDDLVFWEEEVIKMNEWISSGMLVFDNEFNILKDDRPEDAFQ